MRLRSVLALMPSTAAGLKAFEEGERAGGYAQAMRDSQLAQEILAGKVVLRHLHTASSSSARPDRAPAGALGRHVRFLVV